MNKVFLDGEMVDFQGPAPATVADVWSALEGFLSQSGSVIKRLIVDGKEWSPGDESDQEGFKKIEVISATQEESVLNLVNELLSQEATMRDLWRSQARASLSLSWDRFSQIAIEALNQTEPLVGCLELLKEYARISDATWRTELEHAVSEFNSALNGIMDAIEKSDCVAFSEVSEYNLLPGLVRVYRILAELVVVSLRSS